LVKGLFGGPFLLCSHVYENSSSLYKFDMYIYSFTSPSGKRYIGQTVQKSVAIRFSQHIFAWRRWREKGFKERANSTKLYWAFEKYSPETWKVEIIDSSATTQEELNQLEVKYIKEFDTVENGYNVHAGGYSGWGGLRLSDEHRQKQSEARKAFYETPEGKADLESKRRHFREHNPSRREGYAPWNTGKKAPQISAGIKNRSEEDAGRWKENISKSRREHAIFKKKFWWRFHSTDGEVIDVATMKDFCLPRNLIAQNFMRAYKSKPYKGWWAEKSAKPPEGVLEGLPDDWPMRVRRHHPLEVILVRPHVGSSVVAPVDDVLQSFWIIKVRRLLLGARILEDPALLLVPFTRRQLLA
jgi:hypothetical protein